jgi:ubiquinone/menaquinone biosynthesis C-methylase UbiE
MHESQRELVAASLSATDIRLMDHIPYLLQDLWELGSDPQEIAGMLAGPAQLGASSRVLDLGCGKGAVSVEVARRIGCIVEGRDLMAPFIDVARRKAQEFEVGHLCRFEVADIFESVETERDFDAVIFGAVGDLFETQYELLEQLKRTVKPRGYLVIDDAFALTGDEYLSLKDWYRILDEARCEIVEEVPVDPAIVAATNRYAQRSIEHRAAELTERYPESADLFADYVADQLAECAELESWLQGITWLLRVK